MQMVHHTHDAVNIPDAMKKLLTGESQMALGHSISAVAMLYKLELPLLAGQVYSILPTAGQCTPRGGPEPLEYPALPTEQPAPQRAACQPEDLSTSHRQEKMLC